jgi:hypothetical protein
MGKRIVLATAISGESAAFHGKTSARVRRLAPFALALALTSALVIASPGYAVTSIDGPIDLGTATTFGVLASSKVTNTGSSVIAGDIGVSPETSITGFPPGTQTSGVVHATDDVAASAQADLTTAYNVAGSLTPTVTGLANLGGKSLVPGVYAGNLSLTGVLTLEGNADSVWVFQASSSLLIASGSKIVVNGGSSCNVFWRVPSSATLGSGADFTGTIMANSSITLDSAVNVKGRLLASTAAVTLINDTITAPTGCDSATTSTVTTTPSLDTVELPTATIGARFDFQLPVAGSPTPTATITEGGLPAGVELDTTTGMITGTPLAAGRYPFTVTASNGVGPAVTASYVLAVLPALAATGADVPWSVPAGALLLLAIGGGLATRSLRGTRRHRA